MVEGTKSQTKVKPLCAVIDTNQWRSELLLKKHLGAALLHLLRRLNASIALPEIIEKEIRKQIVRAGNDATAKIDAGFRNVEILLGWRVDYKVPCATDFEKAVERRIAEMEQFLVRVPFTLEHAKAALDMIHNDLPPNGPKNQQFKDSAIWQALLELSEKHDVVFITSDHGFFKEGKPDKGLADNLMADCLRLGARIDVFCGIPSCLTALQKDAPALDKTTILSTIRDHLHERLSHDVAQRGFSLGDILSSNIKPFATERIEVLALSFDLTYNLMDTSQSGALLRANARVQVIGDCSYRTDSKRIEDMRLTSELIAWTDQEGKTVGNHTLFASPLVITMREPLVFYTLRHPVD